MTAVTETKNTVRVACLQYTPGEDLQDNATTALSLARTAVDRGARFLFLPEYASALHASGKVMKSVSCEEQAHPLVTQLREFARTAGAWILIGSVTIPVDDEHLANRSLLISDSGEIVARYDKLHMFEVTLPNGRHIREASLYQAGTTAMVAPTPWGNLGLSICYDLRFPYLYRELAQSGAVFMTVPSAFTAVTGELHWHMLIRARAIENGCYIVAPATCGTHPGGHATYGHSLIVDPKGRIVSDGGTDPGVVVADLDMDEVAKARAALPSLMHSRTFEMDAPPSA